MDLGVTEALDDSGGEEERTASVIRSTPVHTSNNTIGNAQFGNDHFPDSIGNRSSRNPDAVKWIPVPSASIPTLETSNSTPDLREKLKTKHRGIQPGTVEEEQNLGECAIQRRNRSRSKREKMLRFETRDLHAWRTSGAGGETVAHRCRGSNSTPHRDARLDGEHQGVE